MTLKRCEYEGEWRVVGDADPGVFSKYKRLRSCESPAHPLVVGDADPGVPQGRIEFWREGAAALPYV